MEDIYKNLDKDNLIILLNESKKREQKLKKQLDKLETKCESKIKDIESRCDKQKYREWKQHINTGYMDRFLREWMWEHLGEIYYKTPYYESKGLTGSLWGNK